MTERTPDQLLEDWMVIRHCREAEKRFGGKMRTYAIFRWGVNCCLVTPERPWRAKLRVRWLWLRCQLLRLRCQLLRLALKAGS